MERLQKVMAQCGVASRRKSEELILDGKVKVNGKVCTVLGTCVSDDDTIEVNGKVIGKEKIYRGITNVYDERTLRNAKSFSGCTGKESMLKCLCN